MAFVYFKVTRKMANLSLCHAVKGCRGSGGKSHIYSRSCRWMVSFVLQPHYPREKSWRCRLDSGLGGHQS